MSEHLPVRKAYVDVEPYGEGGRAPVTQRIRRWVGSPIGTAVAELAPDLIRYFGRNTRSESRVIPDLPQPGANGLNVSEIEVDISAPFIRKLTIRTARSWSVSPQVFKESQSSNRGRFGIGLLSVAALTVFGIFAARRSSFLSIPARTRVAPSSEVTSHTSTGYRADI